MDSEHLTDEEELDIKQKFIDADSIIKTTTLKSLSMVQNKYYSTLIDVQEIAKSLEGITSISKGSLTIEIPSEY
ncbi:23337_t:CDS:2 [Dentiscutata erythropus]|uniref:23337_t:CDS:1 n=1 Tax=Dentiscutata erythropus TaxID=1348616 RepID=A0A9N9IQU3_9GLOM|nr:23337_t:CDS:2 [Dentiscutata erythropus]